MKRVISAIEAGRCAIAVGGALLRDSEVMLTLRDRGALMPMALSGPAVAPVIPAGDQGLLRAIAQKNGVLVLVEPESGDDAGLRDLGKTIQGAANKPMILVVARSFNPFALMSMFPGAKVEHLKGRGKNFLRDLPIPPATEDLPELTKPVTRAAKIKETGAPRMQFVGREEQLPALTEMLQQGGPVVVSGPRGIGKHWLASHAIAAAELTRTPDVVLGFGVGFDTLIARIAELTNGAGVATLADALKGEHTPISLIDAAVSALSDASSLEQTVMVIDNLHLALGRESDFFRKSRLEMLCEALLSNSYALRVVFLSLSQPVLFKEGQQAALRRIEIEPLKGRFFFDIFQAYKAPEFARERFGPISERLFGLPMAARAFAVEVRDRDNGVELTEDDRFFKMKAADDTEPLRRRISKRLEKLSKRGRAALSTLAHFRLPVDGNVLTQLGINKATRIELLSAGVLDYAGTNDSKLYRVHPVVRRELRYREVNDFDVYGELTDLYTKAAASSEGVDALAAQQEANRCAYAGRHLRKRLKVAYPDNDPVIESVIGMIRSKKPNLPLAEQRLNELLKAQPSNADGHLLRIELYAGLKSDKLQGAMDEALKAAPVPEVFHAVAGQYLQRRARHKAIEVLEQAVAALPSEARIRCRLGSLLLRHGRRNEAIEQFKEAMALAPMLPDAYGLLGMTKRDEGQAALDDAESLLREAVRLAPGDTVQTSRLADLLIDKARVTDEPEARDALFGEARDLLEEALKGEERAPEAHLTLASLVRLTTLDFDRANWLLSKAKKHTDRGHERHHRISIERALVNLAKGELDNSEKLLREQIERNPSSYRAFAALSQVLEAKQQYIPAHAEMLRAAERVPQGSLAASEYGRAAQRLQALIEAQAQGLLQQSAAAQPAEDAALPTGSSSSAGQVKRRKKADEAAAEVAETDSAAEVAETDGAAEVAEPDSAAEAAASAAPAESPEAPSAEA